VHALGGLNCPGLIVDQKHVLIGRMKA
jgi:hypothetical protein